MKNIGIAFAIAGSLAAANSATGAENSTIQLRSTGKIERLQVRLRRKGSFHGDLCERGSQFPCNPTLAGTVAASRVCIGDVRLWLALCFGQVHLVDEGRHGKPLRQHVGRKRATIDDMHGISLTIPRGLSPLLAMRSRGTGRT